MHMAKLSQESEDSYLLPQDYTENQVMEKCLMWHSIRCVELLSRKPPHL